MRSIQSIRRRIDSIKKTKQITNSMRLVASSKINSSREYMESNIPFYDASVDLMDFISQSYAAQQSKYFVPKQEKRTAIIVISSDRGLCGAYNTNISHAVTKLCSKKNNTLIITIGNKILNSLQKNNIDIDITYLGISETPFYEEACIIGDNILDLLKNDKIHEVYIIYTKFVSMLDQQAVSVKLLPYEVPQNKHSFNNINSEPDMETFIRTAVPKYINSSVFNAMLHSAASEQASRVTSMDSASKNSDEIISDLTLKYNQARQAIITQEISEIMSDAKALDK